MIDSLLIIVCAAVSLGDTLQFQSLIFITEYSGVVYYILHVTVSMLSFIVIIPINKLTTTHLFPVISL